MNSLFKKIFILLKNKKIKKKQLIKDKKYLL